MSNFKEQYIGMPVQVNSCRYLTFRNQDKLFKKLHVIVLFYHYFFARHLLKKKELTVEKILPSKRLR